MSYQKRVIIFLSVMAVLTGILIGIFILNTQNRLQGVDTQNLLPSFEDYGE